MYIYIYIVQVRCHRSNAASSLAADCNVPQCPLQKSEVLHLFRWYTHTHAKTQLPQQTRAKHIFETYPQTTSNCTPRNLNQGRTQASTFLQASLSMSEP